jgi:hypothetical protein
MGGYTPTRHFKTEWPVYPPSTLLLLLPLALMPWSVFSVVWMLLSFAFLSATFIVLFLVCRAYRDLLSVIPFFLLLSDWSMGWAVELGQPVMIAASALALAIVALESGAMPITGGLLLALSLLIKPQGAYLCVVYFLLKKSTRLPVLGACILTAIAGAAGTLLFYFRLSSFAYLSHLTRNLKLAVQPGGDADFSLLYPESASFLNLQAFIARFRGNPPFCNNVTYAVCLLLIASLIFVCWRKQTLATRPYTILAVLVMIELLVSYHRLYDHVLMLSAIPGMYEIKERGRFSYLLFVCGLFVYHFSQFHGITIHGLGPFSSGPPVELFVAGICLTSLWKNRPLLTPQIANRS